MVDRYLDREGIFEEETQHIIEGHNISKLEKQNQSLAEELSMLKESNAQLTADLETVKKELAGLFEGKNFMKLFKALLNNQKKISKTIEQMTRKKFDAVLQRQPSVLNEIGFS